MSAQGSIQATVPASAWLIYVKERFPLPVYLVLVAGFCASGALLVGGNVFAVPTAMAFFGLMLFFAMLRMMDEVKDYQKDKVANPTRPLPRGLLPLALVKNVIASTVMGMVGFSLSLGIVYSWQAGVTYLFLTGWLWLMYREFYTGHWLEQRPLLYAITHQFILVPVTLLPIVMNSPGALFETNSWQFAGLIVGSFFSYEVCRKLNPHAHALLKTYRAMYGMQGVFVIVTCASALAAAMAWQLGMQAYLWPFSLALLISFIFIPLDRHKVVETVATISLVVHIWSIVLYRLKEWL